MSIVFFLLPGIVPPGVCDPTESISDLAEVSLSTWYPLAGIPWYPLANYAWYIITRRLTAPLADLLDPVRVDAMGSRPAKQHLFMRFAVATYGRTIIASFLQAAFESTTAEDLAESAFHTKLSVLEEQWHDWMGDAIHYDE